MIKPAHPGHHFSSTQGIGGTYGHIALRAGLKGYARYVGYVLRNLPKARVFLVPNCNQPLAFP